MRMGCLAQVLQHLGRLPEAEQLARQALAGQHRVLGNDHHRDTLISMEAVAEVLKAQGKNSEAELLFRECLEVSRRTLGPQRPGTLASLSTLATLFCEEGKLAEAEALYCVRLWASPGAFTAACMRAH